MRHFYRFPSESLDIVLAGHCARHFKRCHPHVLALNVGVLDQSAGHCSAPRVHLQHSADQPSGAINEERVRFVLAPLDSLVEVLFACASKGKVASKHHVEQHSEGPNVDWHALVVRLLGYLWSHVGWRAAEHFKSLVRLCDKHRKAKVNQLHHPSPFL